MIINYSVEDNRGMQRYCKYSVEHNEILISCVPLSSVLGLSREEASVLSIFLTCLRMPCITALYYPVVWCGAGEIGSRRGLEVLRKRRRDGKDKVRKGKARKISHTCPRIKHTTE